MFSLFFLLLISHAVCDFALQSDYIAQAKNRHTQLGKDVWYMVLPAHGLVHSGGVYLVTMSVWWAFFQFVTHVIIDYIKCDNRLTYRQDQLLHVGVMFLIALLA